MVPVPESLMSPDYRPPPLIERLGKANTGTPTKSRQVEAVRSPKSSRVGSPFVKSQINERKGGTPSPNRQRRVVDSNIK